MGTPDRCIAGSRATTSSTATRHLQGRDHGGRSRRFPLCIPCTILDEATYSERATQSGLALDPEFPIAVYPELDATIVALRADPYNPKTNGSLVRYPAMTGFDLAELDYARLQVQQLVAPMAGESGGEVLQHPRRGDPE